MPTTFSYKLVEFVKSWEGFKPYSYQDQAGVWTIGYGHTEGVGPNMTINEWEAAEQLQHNLEKFAVGVRRNVDITNLNQHQFDALVSFVFNVGIGAFSKSTMCRMLNFGNFNGAAHEFNRWVFVRINNQKVRSNGLVRRRAAEKIIFTRGDYITNGVSK